MSETHRLLKARFHYVRQDLERTLSEFNDQELAWAPKEGMRTAQTAQSSVSPVAPSRKAHLAMRTRIARSIVLVDWKA